MKSTARIIAALAFSAVAGCAANIDQPVASAESHTELMTVAALHVALPANAPSGNVYEYSSPMAVSAAKPVQYAVANGNVFEYF